jgi:hypothetical protein
LCGIGYCVIKGLWPELYYAKLEALLYITGARWAYFVCSLGLYSVEMRTVLFGRGECGTEGAVLCRTFVEYWGL